jgi:hypothetical protein
MEALGTWRQPDVLSTERDVECAELGTCRDGAQPFRGAEAALGISEQEHRVIWPSGWLWACLSTVRCEEQEARECSRRPFRPRPANGSQLGCASSCFPASLRDSPANGQRRYK